jgi:hypothetical protein
MPRALVFAVLAAAVVQAEADKPPVPQLTIEYVAPTKRGVIGAPADHIARMRVLIGLLEHQLQLRDPLKIAFVECGAANAYYRSSQRRVEICHELWDKRRTLYLNTGNGREEVDRRLRSAMTFSMFHEIGHALHDQLELPLLGSHEDAVDDIATIWMIRLGVGESARHAAYGHYLRAKQPHYDHDPWDEHGTGAQRGFAIACVLYGSDPERYFGVFTDMSIPAPYISRCQDEYPDRVRAWQKLLGPHLR